MTLRGVASSGREVAERAGVRTLLEGRWGAVLGLALTSLLGGGLEALFLVIVTRAAVAMTERATTVAVGAGYDLGLVEVLWVAAALALGRAALAGATAWQAARLTTSVIASLRVRLSRAFLNAAWSAQHGERVGHLQELLTTFSQHGLSLILSLTSGVSSGFALVALLGAAIVVDPAASIMMMIVVGVLAAVLKPIRDAVRRQARASTEKAMRLATALSEVSQTTMEMHVFNVQRQMAGRVEALVHADASVTRRLQLLRNLVPVIYTALAYLALVGGIALVASIETANMTSVGAVMLLMLRSLTYGQALQTAATMMSGSLPFLGVLRAELVRYGDARVHTGGEPVGSVGSLALRDVSFEYVPGRPVLHGIDFTIRPREVVGVIGPSGGGKSTLMQLLLGLRQATTGVVLADGRDVSNLDKHEWARKVTFVPQQPRLLAGTVAENIRFFREASAEEVVRAAQLANLHDDVMEWADQYDHDVGEQGGKLSGGQQQRLIIARALVESPDVLILDEPTSSLDVKSERLIRKTLDGLRQRMTVIIVAHRLSTLEICDRIMVIQRGKLRAFDTPSELQRSNAFYRDVFQQPSSQLDDEQEEVGTPIARAEAEERSGLSTSQG